jgi:FkbM family methyltransferase
MISLRSLFEKSTELTTRLDKLPFKMCGPTSDKSVMSYIYEHKTWEPHISRLVRKLLKQGDNFIDIGANLGYYILLSAHLVGPKGRVIAFEPIPKNYSYCQKNITINKIKNAVIYNHGIWNENTKKKMTFPEESLGNCQVNEHGTVEVELVALDSLDLKPDFIKMDIEGAEPFALDGMRHTLERYHPTMIVEMNRLSLRFNFGLDSDTYWSFFQKTGYTLSVIQSDASTKKVASLEELKAACPPDWYIDLLAL